MSNIIHPLYTDIQPPKQFTFPFCYAPHPLCELAAEAVQRHIRTSGVCDGEGGGKMFGVLVVRNKAADGQPLVSDGTAEVAPYAFLAAYSGLLSGRNDWSVTFFPSSPEILYISRFSTLLLIKKTLTFRRFSTDFYLS